LGSSLDDVSILNALNKLLDSDLEVDSLDAKIVLVFCVVGAKDFPFFIPSSY